jgi:DNA-binding NarL/FixJ family response regulator
MVELCMRRVSIVIGVRYPIVLHGLTTILASENDFIVVASCQDGGKCLQIIRALSPDIALLEMYMPSLNGLDILAAVSSERSSTRVVFLAAAADDQDIMMAAARGAYGAVLKESTPTGLVHCLRQVADGQRLLPLTNCASSGKHKRATAEGLLAMLTPRERQIMTLVSEGLSNKEIGRRLNACDGTIKVHLHNIYQKLAIGNRSALAVLACSSRNTEW